MIDPGDRSFYNTSMEKPLLEQPPTALERQSGRFNRVVKRLAVVGVGMATLNTGGLMAHMPVNFPNNTRLVAMGDSFTSGNNNGEVRDTNGNDIYENCFQDAPSYADMVAESLGITNFEKVACSGATPEEVLTGRYGEQPQIDALTEDTNYILITIGANVVNLSELLEECQSNSCSIDTNPMRTVLERIASKEYRQNIEQTLLEVTKRAPNADVLVVSYPRIIDRSAWWCGALISPEIDTFVEEYIDGINSSLASVVDVINDDNPTKSIFFVKLKHKIDLCRSLGKTFFVDPSIPRALGHPTQRGYEELAKDVEDALVEIARK